MHSRSFMRMDALGESCAVEEVEVFNPSAAWRWCVVRKHWNPEATVAATIWQARQDWGRGVLSCVGCAERSWGAGSVGTGGRGQRLQESLQETSEGPPLVQPHPLPYEIYFVKGRSTRAW